MAREATLACSGDVDEGHGGGLIWALAWLVVFASGSFRRLQFALASLLKCWWLKSVVTGNILFRVSSHIILVFPNVIPPADAALFSFRLSKSSSTSTTTQ